MASAVAQSGCAAWSSAQVATRSSRKAAGAAAAQGCAPRPAAAAHRQQQRCAVRAAAAAAATANGAAATNGSSSNGGGESTTPSAAETARTVVDLVAHGTLCTVGEDGIPLGTYVTYVLDDAGQPILRLRADAVHTANLSRDSKCSLFVQPGEHPARLLARVTLIGAVEPVGPELAEQAAAAHNTLHAGGAGVDAPQPTDLYFRLAVDRCFYVGGLNGGSAADVIPGDAYRAAETDPLRTCAARLAAFMNAERVEDVLRISCQQLGAAFEDTAWAEMLWVDRLGVYMRAAPQDGGDAKEVRVPFVRPVEDEREARSALTMMAQVAWESQRPYQPQAVVPPSAPQDPANN
ncbi:glutamyl-tRNA reductase-binding chloroplastic [Micractinium conductrix]|uniref:Glutamyl-tRNA reductase-binding chloroplastic n=1 Tax=Micractinium conductrix TaxID=554055 RepID=A0A2P6VAU4_9CHLO|nr:glutamyl-tRNA reductase-binding chloroplastic [Micractinium conductrix]|eukprot:PSC71188.1 glutamyl-tRNA reductase-binding chloroplastic [Micractinium conductrix]